MSDEKVIVPTIGRRVWFKNSSMSDQFCDAGIAYVFEGQTGEGEYYVNLSVADCHGNMHSFTSVRLFQGPPEECPEYACCWMPYQKQQASREERK